MGHHPPNSPTCPEGVHECRCTAWKAQTSEEGCQLLAASISVGTVMRLVLQILEKLKTGYGSCHGKEWLLQGDEDKQEGAGPLPLLQPFPPLLPGRQWQSRDTGAGSSPGTGVWGGQACS